MSWFLISLQAISNHHADLTMVVLWHRYHVIGRKIFSMWCWWPVNDNSLKWMIPGFYENLFTIISAFIEICWVVVILLERLYDRQDLNVKLSCANCTELILLGGMLHCTKSLHEPVTFANGPCKNFSEIWETFPLKMHTYVSPATCRSISKTCRLVWHKVLFIRPKSFIDHNQHNSIIENFSGRRIQFCRFHTSVISQYKLIVQCKGTGIIGEYAISWETMLMTTELRNLYVTIHMRIKNTRKKFKNFKPYWSNELIELWRDMVDSEEKT